MKRWTRRGWLAGGAAGALRAHEDEGNAALDRTALLHGSAEPLAVAGYRMGEAALAALGLRRGSPEMEVTQYGPRRLEWTCVVDGLQASTGASLGKMNLALVEAPESYSVVRHRKTGQSVRLELTASFLAAHWGLADGKKAGAAARVTGMAAAEIFVLR